jgi:NADH dehydrogenase FAD-containing subunit
MTNFYKAKVTIELLEANKVRQLDLKERLQVDGEPTIYATGHLDTKPL